MPGRLSFDRVSVAAAAVVGQRRWCQTDIRGLVTARRWFGANGGCSLGSGVTSAICRVLLWLIAVTKVQFACLAGVQGTTPIKFGGGYSKVASDQHQPASSRATATLATTRFFLRSLNRHHCWCRRRFPACPRALRAGSTLAQRARIVGPGLR